MKKLLPKSALLTAALSFTLPLALPAAAQTVSAYCSTNQSWCEMAATEFSKASNQALAPLKAEANNPNADIRYRD